MSALDEMANTDLYCDGCGRQTTRLFDGDQCAVCQFSYLEHRLATVTAALDLFEHALDRTLGLGVHPDDLRKWFERGLAELPELNYQCWDDLNEQVTAMGAALKDEVA
jgi:hypothetical protein